jgi:hypothetical protein
MHSTELEYLCTKLVCIRQSYNTFVQRWNAFNRVGMLSAGLECFLEGWNAFDRVGIPLYTVGMLSAELVYLCTQLECFLQGWNAFDRARIPLYRVGMLSAGLECFL